MNLSIVNGINQEITLSSFAPGTLNLASSGLIPLATALLLAYQGEAVADVLSQIAQSRSTEEEPQSA